MADRAISGTTEQGTVQNRILSQLWNTGDNEKGEAILSALNDGGVSRDIQIADLPKQTKVKIESITGWKI